VNIFTKNTGESKWITKIRHLSTLYDSIILCIYASFPVYS